MFLLQLIAEHNTVHVLADQDAEKMIVDSTYYTVNVPADRVVEKITVDSTE